MKFIDASANDIVEIFQELDANKDGEISQIEFIKGLRKNPLLAERLEMPSVIHQESESRTLFQNAFHEIDVNDSKTVDLEEFLRFYQPRRPPTPDDVKGKREAMQRQRTWKVLPEQQTKEPKQTLQNSQAQILNAPQQQAQNLQQINLQVVAHESKQSLLDLLGNGFGAPDGVQKPYTLPADSPSQGDVERHKSSMWRPPQIFREPIKPLQGSVPPPGHQKTQSVPSPRIQLPQKEQRRLQRSAPLAGQSSPSRPAPAASPSKPKPTMSPAKVSTPHSAKSPAHTAWVPQSHVSPVTSLMHGPNPILIRFSAQELRQKLINFYAKVCPAKLGVVENILSHFAQRGGASAEDLLNFNMKLRERYGSDLDSCGTIASNHGAQTFFYATPYISGTPPPGPKLETHAVIYGTPPPAPGLLSRTLGTEHSMHSTTSHGLNVQYSNTTYVIPIVRPPRVHMQDPNMFVAPNYTYHAPNYIPVSAIPAAPVLLPSFQVPHMSPPQVVSPQHLSPPQLSPLFGPVNLCTSPFLESNLQPQIPFVQKSYPSPTGMANGGETERSVDDSKVSVGDPWDLRGATNTETISERTRNGTLQYMPPQMTSQSPWANPHMEQAPSLSPRMLPLADQSPVQVQMDYQSLRSPQNRVPSEQMQPPLQVAAPVTASPSASLQVVANMPPASAPSPMQNVQPRTAQRHAPPLPVEVSVLQPAQEQGKPGQPFVRDLAPMQNQFANSFAAPMTATYDRPTSAIVEPAQTTKTSNQRPVRAAPRPPTSSPSPAQMNVSKHTPVKRGPDFKVGVGLLLQKTGDDKHVEVADIVPFFAAHDSDQFDVSDLVLSIDGIQVQGMPLESIKEMTVGPPGSNVTFIMRSLIENRDYRVTLTRKEPDLINSENEVCAQQVFSRASLK